MEAAAATVEEGTDKATMETTERCETQVRVGISLDSTTDLQELQGQMQCLAALEHVDIYVERSFVESAKSLVLSEDFGRLMKTIGSLPKLQWLRIRSSSISGQWVAIPFSALDTLLKTSQSLKYLHLSYVEFIVPDDEIHGSSNNSRNNGNGNNVTASKCPLMAIATLMKDNTTVQELRLTYGGFQQKSTESQQALLRMLQYHNFTLECLEFDRRTLRQISPGYKKELAFWLALNQKGLRQRLLDPNSNPTEKDWQDAVVDNRKKTGVVYYLLCNNPTVLIQS